MRSPAPFVVLGLYGPGTRDRNITDSRCRPHIDKVRQHSMMYDQRGPRPMVDVTSLNLTCATCGTPITELPFQPAMNDDGTPQRPVYCKEHKPQRKAFGGAPRGPRY